MLFLSILLIFIGIYSYKKNKGLDLLSLFCFIWCVVFGFASLKLYGMRDYSFDTVLLFAMGTVAFITFAIAGRYGKYKHYRIKHGKLSNSSNVHVTINKTILYIFLVPVTAVVIYSILRMLALFSSGVPLGTIHAMFLGRGGESFFTLNILNQLHSKFIIPCIYCLAPIAVYYSLTDFRNNWIAICVASADIVLYLIATGSRIIAIFIFVDIFLMLPYANIVLSKKAFKRIKKIGFILCFLVVLILIYYTISRKGFTSTSESNIFEQLLGEIYKYFSLCIPLSDYWFSEVNTNGFLTYGKMSFYGLLSLVEWFFVQFFKTDMFSSLEICRNLASSLEIMKPIFSDAKCNAFVTYIFYFYVDFGYVGVILLTSIWGFICGSISRKIKVKHNESTMLFYLLFAQTISMSFSRWCFFDAPYILAFVYMRVLFIGSKSTSINKNYKGANE